MAYSARLKRLVLGRALRTEQGRVEVGRVRAISSLASDALSSNVYATQEILIVLAVGGFGLYRYGPAIAGCVVVVFAIVVLAYRHTVREYTGGGADYAVAARNLGPTPAVVVAAAMLIDFALTLSVSVAAILETLVSVLPDLYGARVGLGVGLVAVMTVLSLRGSPAIASLLHVGIYAFVVAILATTAVAAIRVLQGDTPRAVSADWELASTSSAAGFALLVVLARSFSSGSIAVTGVEAVGTGVPLFRRPRGANAAATLVILGVLSMALFGSITWLALVTGVRVAADDGDLIGLAPGEHQQTVVVQVAQAVFGNDLAVAALVAVTVLILLAAGLSSFRSFSVLSSVLARDGFLPRQLESRGDRLVYSNGILLLAVAAGALLWGFGARLTDLIQLYVVGVFLALTMGQAGMVRHWTRLLRARLPADQRAAARRARAVAVLAQWTTAGVLAVVLVSKFTSGAWLVVLLIPLLAYGMRGVRRHYDTVAYEMAAEEQPVGAPSHDVDALILVSRIHRPTLRAVAYARATRPSTLEAITVAVDDREAEHLTREWDARGVPVPLRVLESPFREINSPIIGYVAQLRRQAPGNLLTIYIPEYVVEHWWERLLHNQSAARLKRRLMALPDVVVVSVPWQLGAGEPDQAVPAAETGSGPP